MAEKIFIIYSTDTGTSTARPVLEYYTDDDTHAPDVTLLGYTNAAWAAIDSLDNTDTAQGTTRSLLTINPTTKVVSSASVARYDVTHAQTEVLGQIADLIAEWNWTQELDAKITKETQQAFASWIEALDAIPNNALWATNPKGITLPSPPSVTSASNTVARQVSKAEWTDDAVMPSQKMNISNWDTLQTIWGFDTEDLSVFGSHPNVTLSWSPGRSGYRSLRATAPVNSTTTMWIRPLVHFAFAMSPGDTFYIEAWIRGNAQQVNIGLVGFDAKVNPTPYNGGDTTNSKNINTAAFTRFSGYVQVPSGNPIRWGTAEVTFRVLTAGQWLEIDNLTITRVPRIPNAYSVSSATQLITATGTAFESANEILGLGFFHGGNSAFVKLETTIRIVPANTSSDAMRMQFWLTRTTQGSAEEVLTTWLEYSNGPQNHRNTSMMWPDQATDSKEVYYSLKCSKLNSVNAMSVAHRSLHATLLPRLGM